MNWKRSTRKWTTQKQLQRLLEGRKKAHRYPKAKAEVHDRAAHPAKNGNRSETGRYCSSQPLYGEAQRLSDCLCVASSQKCARIGRVCSKEGKMQEHQNYGFTI